MDYYGQLSDESSINNATATFSIDGQSRSQLPLVNWNSVPTPANTPLFQSGRLPDGLHNLTVVYDGNATTVALALESLIFQTSPLDRSTNITRGNPTSPTASMSNPRLTNNLIKGDSQAVPIVAGVFGSLVALVGAALILFLLRRQRKKRHDVRVREEILNPEFDDAASVSSATIPTPFFSVNQRSDSIVPNTSEMSQYGTKETTPRWMHRNQITPQTSNDKTMGSPPQYVP